MAPAIDDGELVGWVANRAHHADLGGAAPGSIPADATEIQQEGLRIPPVRLTPRSAPSSSQLADARGAGRRPRRPGGRQRRRRRRAGRASLAAPPFDEVVAYGERRMRAALPRCPTATWTFEDVLDSTGAAADQQRPARIRRDADRRRRRGRPSTSPAPTRSAPGNVNAVEAVTVSAVAFALRSAVDPTIPANGGALRPVEVVAPAGTVVAPRSPAAVGAGNVEVSQRVADVCLGALAEPVPDRVPAAGQGTMNNLLVGGGGWVYYETVGGGQGGRPDRRRA